MFCRKWGVTVDELVECNHLAIDNVPQVSRKLNSVRDALAFWRHEFMGFLLALKDLVRQADIDSPLP
jgi:hypothetical protein